MNKSQSPAGVFQPGFSFFSEWLVIERSLPCQRMPKDIKKTNLTRKDMPCLQLTFSVAQKMGA